MTETPGRVGRPREHHPRRAGRRRRCTSSTGTSGSARIRRATCSWCSRRRPAGLSCFLVERGPGMEFQRLKDKLGHAVAALVRGRVPRRAGAARRRGGARRARDHPDGQPHPARLPARRRHRAAAGHGRGDPPRAPPRGVRRAARRAAGDAATCSRTSRSSPRPRPPPRCASPARYDDPDEGAFRRFATAVMKYWVCKRAAPHAAEALECLGGNGFVEDSGLPLLYRDAPLNSIWEGSGNVAALDVLRAMVKEPDGLPAFLDECELAAGADARLDAHLERVRAALSEVFAVRGDAAVRGAPGGRGPRRRASGRRCSCAPPRRRSPTRSAPPGSTARRRVACTGRSRAGVDAAARSSTGRCRREHRRRPRDARAAAGGRARADRGGRVRLRVGGRDRRPRRGGRGHAVPALRLQGRAVPRGVPGRLRGRGARDAGRGGRTRARARWTGSRPCWRRSRGGRSQNRRLAWALLAEPVDPLVDAERLAYRERYATLVADELADRDRRRRDPGPGRRLHRRGARRGLRRGAGRAAVVGASGSDRGRRAIRDVRAPGDRGVGALSAGGPGRARRAGHDRAAVAARAPQRGRRRRPPTR